MAGKVREGVRTAAAVVTVVVAAAVDNARVYITLCGQDEMNALKNGHWGFYSEEQCLMWTELLPVILLVCVWVCGCE